jgi:hypothetical protein
MAVKERAMPKFKVLIEEVVQYVVEVDAAEMALAGDAAMEVMKGSDDPQRYLHAVSGREVSHVYREGKALPVTC